MPHRTKDPASRAPLNVYLECSETASNGLKTGIQRVVRNLIQNHANAARDVGVQAAPAQLFRDSFYAFAWRPARDSAKSHWGSKLHQRLSRWCGPRTADRWMPRFNMIAARLHKAFRFRRFRRRCRAQALRWFHRPLRPNPGDVMVLADATWGLPIWSAVERWKAEGGRVAFVIYDLLAITHSDCFRPSLTERFTEWFDQVWDHADLLLAISDTVRDQLRALPEQARFAGRPAPRIESFSLGAELDMHHEQGHVRSQLLELLEPTAGPRPYLTVGTIEPRKNHRTVLDAFDRLWQAGRDVRLFLVGRRGWECEALASRILQHPRLGRELHWFPDLTDTELDACYRQARAVIFASWGEGYGLPVVEGLHYGLPVIASNLPVHREVAGEHAAYFDPHRPAELVDWIERLEATGKLPGVRPANEFKPVRWSEATAQLLARCRDFSENLSANSREKSPRSPLDAPPPQAPLRQRAG